MGALYLASGALLGVMAARISADEPGWAWLIVPAALALVVAVAIDLKSLIA